MRKLKFETDKYYHIYNRGVDKREIFLDEKDFARFILSMREFNVIEAIGSLYEHRFKNKLSFQLETKFVNKPKLVNIVCYCLNPNHYHFVFKQLIDSGIAKFMHRLNLGYTKYFNRKYNRCGSLFQGTYNAKHINTAKYLAWCSGYVNGNVEIHKFAKARDFQWSSYRDYLNLRNGTLCDKDIVMNEFNGDIKEYEIFIENVVRDCQDKKDAIKEYLAELE